MESRGGFGASRDRFPGRERGHMDRGPSRPIPTEPPFTAFVGNLGFDVAEEELENAFSGIKVGRNQSFKMGLIDQCRLPAAKLSAITMENQKDSLIWILKLRTI